MNLQKNTSPDYIWLRHFIFYSSYAPPNGHHTLQLIIIALPLVHASSPCLLNGLDLTILLLPMFPTNNIALYARENITFVLGHALCMKAIHGVKAKNDRIDAHKITVLLRGGMLPMAYFYSREMRATRDLLRRRTHLVKKKAELLVHVQNTNYQYNLAEIGEKNCL